MASHLKYLSILFAIFLLATVPARGAVEDVLFVNLIFDSSKPQNQALSVIDADLKSIDDASLFVPKDTSFILSLVADGKEIAKTQFGITQDSEQELITLGQSNFKDESSNTRQGISIPVVLRDNIQVAETTLVIKNNSGQEILSVNFRDVPHSISSAKNFSLISAAEPSFPPFEQTKEATNIWLWIYIVIGIIAAIVISLIFWHRGKAVPPPIETTQFPNTNV